MPKVSIVYKGTPVITNFVNYYHTKNFYLHSKAITYDLEDIGLIKTSKLMIPCNMCWIDSGNDDIVLQKIIRLIDSSKIGEIFRTLKNTFAKDTNPSSRLVTNFLNIESETLDNQDKDQQKFQMFAQQRLNQIHISKLVIKVNNLITLYWLRHKHNLTLRECASRMNMTISRASYLWYSLTKSECKIKTAVIDKIKNDLVQGYELKTIFEANVSNNSFLSHTLTQNHRIIIANRSDSPEILFHKFFKEFTSFGFKLRQISYKRKKHRTISDSHMKSFVLNYLFFIFTPELFEIVFIDESSICPSNFKSKQWQMTGKPNIVES